LSQRKAGKSCVPSRAVTRARPPGRPRETGPDRGDRTRPEQGREARPTERGTVHPGLDFIGPIDGSGTGGLLDHDTPGIRLLEGGENTNAIRYTPERGHIEIRIGREGGRAFIDVMDDGPGIPPEEREKIFDRFYRLDKARSRAEGGTGLGLAIARWAVEANGGTIAFRDTDPPGVCCRVTIPLADG